MEVTAVIVTYGDRATYVQQVVEALVGQGISQVILVDNASADESAFIYHKMASRIPDQFYYLPLDSNTGSAFGYKHGITYAQKLASEFIWLLDDDNLPEEGALQELKQYWQQAGKTGTRSKGESLALLSYRNDRPLYKKAVISGNPYLMLGPVNSFMGFDLWKKCRNFFVKEGGANISSSTSTVGKVAVAPYGGLFFHKALLDHIGLPDETFYLYGDDYDFSYRITKHGGDIILLLTSKVCDLETSFHLKKVKRGWNRFFKTDSATRIYYSVRNSIRFERKNFVTNGFIYSCNAIAYLALLLVQFALNPDQLKKLKPLFRGLRDGFLHR